MLSQGVQGEERSLRRLQCVVPRWRTQGGLSQKIPCMWPAPSPAAVHPSPTPPNVISISILRLGFSLSPTRLQLGSVFPQQGCNLVHCPRSTVHLGSFFPREGCNWVHSFPRQAWIHSLPNRLHGFARSTSPTTAATTKTRCAPAHAKVPKPSQKSSSSLCGSRGRRARAFACGRSSQMSSHSRRGSHCQFPIPCPLSRLAQCRRHRHPSMRRPPRLLRRLRLPRRPGLPRLLGLLILLLPPPPRSLPGASTRS